MLSATANIGMIHYQLTTSYKTVVYILCNTITDSNYKIYWSQTDTIAWFWL